MSDGAALPTRQDDPRLQGWYHTIELGNGLVSSGAYDHRSVVDRYGIPESLKGMTVLDVGTFDGFWAFELERRGAERVVAIDIARLGDFDWLPSVRARLGASADTQSKFALAHAMRGSKVERKICSVYDLSPSTAGMFDLVFCGDVLLHLFNPIQALLNIRSVTRGMAVIQTSLDQRVEALRTNLPLIRFGFRDFEGSLGEACSYWHFTTKALTEMMEYTGFPITEPQGEFVIPGGPVSVSVVGRLGARAPGTR